MIKRSRWKPIRSTKETAVAHFRKVRTHQHCAASIVQHLRLRTMSEGTSRSQILQAGCIKLSYQIVNISSEKWIANDHSCRFALWPSTPGIIAGLAARKPRPNLTTAKLRRPASRNVHRRVLRQRLLLLEVLSRNDIGLTLE